jgi:hypothetical protein
MKDDEVDCRQASRLLSQAQERPLTDAERQALRRHLDLCFMCRNFDAQLEFLRAASRRMASRS